MTDYKKGKIYKIICNTTQDVYIGSTCKTLTEILDIHKRSYISYMNGKNTDYLTSFKIIDKNNYSIELIENYECNSKNELSSRVRYFTDQIKCVNKNKNRGIIAEMGDKEYKKQYSQQYRINNKKHDCVCGGYYTNINKEKHIRSIQHHMYEEKINK